MTKPQHTPVAIIGGGPVGLTLSALLAKHSIPNTVFEADEGFCTGSRAICLSRRSLEIAAWAGFDQPLLSKALPWTSGKSYYGSKQVLHFSMPHDSFQRFHPMVNIQQYFVEQFAKEAADTAIASCHWNTRLVGIEPQGIEPSQTPIRLRVEQGTPGSGDVRELTADYVVACDGGKSFVRDAMGLSLKGTTYEGRYVIVDIRQKSRRPTERLAWFDPPTNPGSTLLMHRQPEEVWRIDYQVRDDEDPLEAVKPENVLPRVKAHLEWIGENEPWEMLWCSMYNAKCLTLEEYRHGNVFFAGDAAHMVPIFGVRGLNSGIDDVGNLAWKLAAVIQGKAKDSLLETYSTERQAAALANIAFGSKSTEFMAPPNAGFDLMRKAVLRLAESSPEVKELINPRQSLPVPYPDSILSGPDNGFRIGPATGPAIGTVAPDARVSLPSIDFLSQAFGRDYCLLHFSPTSLAPPRLQKHPSFNVLTLNERSDPHGECHSRYAAAQDSLYLIRPDGYVAARWKSADWLQLEQVLSDLCR